MVAVVPETQTRQTRRPRLPRPVGHPGLVSVLPAALFLILFFIVPLADNAYRSITTVVDGQIVYSGQYYVTLFTDPYYLGVIARTILVSLEVTVICIVLGYPIAYFLVRHSGRWSGAVIFILVAPLLTSIIMRTFGWSVIFARGGLLNSALLAAGLIDRPLRLLQEPVSVIVGMVHVLVPFMVISIAAVLRNVHPQLEEAAQLLGAGRARRFLSVVLPLTMEGVATGSIVVFMLANGSFLSMLLLGGGSVTTLPLLIYQQFLLVQNIGFASAMGNVLLVLAVACLFLQLRLVKRRKEQP